MAPPPPSSELPPPPPTNAATSSSAMAVPYFCRKHVALATSRSSTVWTVAKQTGLRSVTVGSDTAVACAVCTDDLPPAATACRLPCGHLYHADCFVQWLSRRNSCPVCRRRVPLFPDHGAAYTDEDEDEDEEEIAPSPPPPHGPETTATDDHRPRSLPGASWIGRICRRLLGYTETSHPRQLNRCSGDTTQQW
ncbi:probable E3 ubiquitin-protein ligase ATL45 [Oryza sativa Japonica Group]|uniref:RING-type domain-containing protein n=1 Tax=Oryza sativa subsp. japonica TaxID=39947 RepID=Q67U43_ORYSJ|nr:zinc finger protein [Oryza sativa Japonica Group]BAD38328.1 hypothetical protein [Oryza sativa Japonica Group]